MAAAWIPRARLAQTVMHAGRLDVEDALQPLHSPARALPPTRSPSLAKPLLSITDAASFATAARLRCHTFG